MERKWMVNEVPKNKLANAVIVKIKPSSKVVFSTKWHLFSTNPTSFHFLNIQFVLVPTHKKITNS